MMGLGSRGEEAGEKVEEKVAGEAKGREEEVRRTRAAMKDPERKTNQSKRTMKRRRMRRDEQQMMMMGMLKKTRAWMAHLPQKAHREFSAELSQSAGACFRKQSW